MDQGLVEHHGTKIGTVKSGPAYMKVGDPK